VVVFGALAAAIAFLAAKVPGPITQVSTVTWYLNATCMRENVLCSYSTITSIVTNDE